MPAARLVIVRKYDSIHEYTVEKAAGWLCFTWLDLVFLALSINLTVYHSHHVDNRLYHFQRFLVIALWIGIKRQVVRKESLLAMSRLGIQLSSNLALALPGFNNVQIPLTGSSKVFIPVSTIQDVLLLEGIQGWAVIWYLAVVQDDGEKVKIHVVFSNTRPRLAVLKEVWKGTRQILDESAASSKAQ